MAQEKKKSDPRSELKKAEKETPRSSRWRRPGEKKSLLPTFFGKKKEKKGKKRRMEAEVTPGGDQQTFASGCYLWRRGKDGAFQRKEQKGGRRQGGTNYWRRKAAISDIVARRGSERAPSSRHATDEEKKKEGKEKSEAG